ncbi:hypothetical protein [Halodesulfovibrio sp.]|uniref:hypothetical protein n=1 Tax=Halodesulfovibrio sp. TaxID=1912772 RepID=UPI0025BBDFE9|nr:hypothetical protein [Halodesulfovibrio sp.]
MSDTKKKSLWSKIVGSGSDCGCCCGSVIEPVPEKEASGDKGKESVDKKVKDKK